jgi:tetratricopeptide (TPR) repeat protein
LLVDRRLETAIGLHRAGKLVEARAVYEDLLRSLPRHFDALQLLGTLHAQQGDYAMALQRLDAALRVDPLNVVVNKNRGQILAKIGRFDDALTALDLAIRVRPDYAEAYFNRGNVLRSLKRWREALASYDEAIRLEPRYVEALGNRGAVLSALERFEEAERNLFEAVRLDPQNAEVHFNHGNLLCELKRFDEALRAYESAISLRPDYVDAHFNLSIALLLVGRHQEGWREYEWRLKRSETIDPGANLGGAAWRGRQRVEGKSLLLYSEQGIGDAIQHLRYVPLLMAQGARVSVALPPKLWPLAGMLRSPVAVLQPGDFLQCDFHCPLMSLPLAMGTGDDNIPSEIPYLFPDTARVARWEQLLGASVKPRIGLVWSGSRDHDNDARRSIDLSVLRPLLELPAEWHSLQIEYRSGDLETLNALRGLLQHQDDIVDLADTAALVQCMDLVITVDTSVAHLAGALGKATYVMLPWMPDYRWMLDRDDSPWYPTAKLFRQPSRGDWSAVLESITGAVSRRFSLCVNQAGSP